MEYASWKSVVSESAALTTRWSTAIKPLMHATEFDIEGSEVEVVAGFGALAEAKICSIEHLTLSADPICLLEWSAMPGLDKLDLSRLHTMEFTTFAEEECIIRSLSSGLLSALVDRAAALQKLKVYIWDGGEWDGPSPHSTPNLQHLELNCVRMNSVRLSAWIRACRRLNRISFDNMTIAYGTLQVCSRGGLTRRCDGLNAGYSRSAKRRKGDV